MASRFWAAGGSSSEEESDYSSESEIETTTQQQQRAASRWAVQSDSESEEETRVVRSAKDKAFDFMEKTCTGIKNYIKINDWTQIQTEYDALFKAVDKNKNVIAAQGYPTFFVRTMVQLEDFLNEKIKNKADQKKMSKENSKALIRMKGKIKKTDEAITKAMGNFRQHPVSSEEEVSESESESDSDSDESDSDEEESEASDEASEEVSEEESAEDDSEVDADKSEGDESDDSWPSDSESSSSSDEDDGELKGRAKWLKQAPVQSSTKDKKAKAPKVARDRVRRPSIEAPKKAVEEELKLSVAAFDRRIKEIVAMRGKKSTETTDQLGQLRKLANYARRLGPARQIVATMYLLGAQLFDVSTKIDRVMSSRHWKTAHNDLRAVMTLLETNPGFSLAPLSTEDQADILQTARLEAAANEKQQEEEDASYVDTLPKAGEKGTVKVSGDLAAFVERLSEEYTKSLQQTDPHTSEYISRLFDEGLLIEIAARVQKYYELREDSARASSVALIRAELVYYKHESIAKALHESQAKRAVYGDPVYLHPACNGSTIEKVPMKQFDASKVHPGAILGQPSVDVPEIDTERELREVCLFVFRHADIRAKTRAMLCRIYHHALHDRFHEARDLLLMSHIQDNITDADIPTQILFNRMMAQLGLCAFRAGLIWEAHACLSEICTGSRTKELLAQGMQSYRYQERDEEAERIERRRQVPYHMHINLDLLETCHLVSAMLLEVPNMVNTRASDRKRVVSKAFRKLLEFHERLVFESPPENPRDHVVAAAKLLAQGSWKKCADLIVGLTVWDLFPGQGTNQRVKEMVKHKIQMEALRTYLLAFSQEYDSIRLARLTEMFDLDEKTVHSVVSKMMINEEVQGAWDQSSKSIVLHKQDRSSLQQLALQYSDKLSQLVENNERMMDLRSSTGNVKEEWGSGRRDGRGGRTQGGTDGRMRSSKGDNRSGHGHSHGHGRNGNYGKHSHSHSDNRKGGGGMKGNKRN